MKNIVSLLLLIKYKTMLEKHALNCFCFKFYLTGAHLLVVPTWLVSLFSVQNLVFSVSACQLLALSTGDSLGAKAVKRLFLLGQIQSASVHCQRSCAQF